MPTSAIEYGFPYNSDTSFSQSRRMSGPYLHHTELPTPISMAPRRYSVQVDRSMYMTTRQQQANFIAQPISQCPTTMQKPPLRNVLSAPISQSLPVLPNTIQQRKDSLRSVLDAPPCSTTELARYKTELCRPFEETGQCRYGAKCQFAHGQQELRNLNRHPKYKTELCRTFHTTGFCSYGQRCNFIHNDEERRGTAPPSAQQQKPPKVVPFNFPLTINSTGDSPPSSITGDSPSLSPTYLNDDVFPTSRLSPTPSYSSDNVSLASCSSGVCSSPPGSPKFEQQELSTLLSPLDMGLDLSLFTRLVL